MKNAVAFGPERDDRENRIHMVDEAVPVKDLIENAKLVADGIMALCCEVIQLHYGLLSAAARIFRILRGENMKNKSPYGAQALCCNDSGLPDMHRIHSHIS